MTLPTAELTITEVAVPASLDDADAADFIAAVALNNAVCLAESGVDDYDRTAPEMPDATVVYDDASEIEMEHFAHVLKPDLIGSGIKEKYMFQKMAIPFRQMHSWDYSGPYHGYKGFPIFARDIDMAINSPTWNLVKAPF